MVYYAEGHIPVQTIMQIFKKIKLYGYEAGVFSFIVLVSALLLTYSIRFVDDAPYYEAVESKTVDAADFTDLGGSSVEAGTLVLAPGGRAEIDVSLDKGDVLQMTVNATTEPDISTALIADLYDESGYDLNGQEQSLTIKSDKTTYTFTLPFYRSDHPSECKLRLYSEGEWKVNVSDVNIEYEKVMINGHKTVNVFEAGAVILLIVSALIFAYNIICLIRDRKNLDLKNRIRNKFSRTDVIAFVCLLVIMVAAVLFLYRKANIRLPFAYENGDEVGVFYYSKLIDEFGTSLVGHRTGGFGGADMYDYPYSDSASFFTVRFLSLFFDSPHVIINCFYLSCFVLSALVAFLCMRYLKVSTYASVAMSVLYGFCPYMQQRYAHIWLVPIYMIPVACLIAIDTIKNEDESKKHFTNIFLLSFLCGFNGLYYAFFACMLIGIAGVIRILNKGFKKWREPAVALLGVIFAVGVNIVPNIIYHMINGSNPASEVAIRGRGEVEIYGLKFVMMLIPSLFHRIKPLSDLSWRYVNEFPMISENTTEVIGLVASTGLLISLLMLFKNKSEHKEISYLNIGLILCGTIGGLSSLIALVISLPVRSYNRLSIVIMFLSVLEIAYILDMLKDKTKAAIWIPVFVLITFIGVFDQTFTYNPRGELEIYEHKRNSIHEIEDMMPEGAMIFELPYGEWPSGGGYGKFIGYIESEDLRWSFGAMQGREESEWQKRVSRGNAASLVDELKRSNYDGIYIDTDMFFADDEDKAREYVDSLTAILGEPSVKDEDGRLYFWKL